MKVLKWIIIILGSYIIGQVYHLAGIRMDKSVLDAAIIIHSVFCYVCTVNYFFKAQEVEK